MAMTFLKDGSWVYFMALCPAILNLVVDSKKLIDSGGSIPDGLDEANHTEKVLKLKKRILRWDVPLLIASGILTVVMLHR